MTIMNEKEPMSLSKKYNIRYTIGGVAWLLYAFLNLIPENSVPLKIVRVLLLLIGVICIVVTMVVKADSEGSGGRVSAQRDCDSIPYQS